MSSSTPIAALMEVAAPPEVLDRFKASPSNIQELLATPTYQEVDAADQQGSLVDFVGDRDKGCGGGECDDDRFWIYPLKEHDLEEAKWARDGSSPGFGFARHAEDGGPPEANGHVDQPRGPSDLYRAEQPWPAVDHAAESEDCRLDDDSEAEKAWD
jgi:hypothetical protein